MILKASREKACESECVVDVLRTLRADVESRMSVDCVVRLFLRENGICFHAPGGTL